MTFLQTLANPGREVEIHRLYEEAEHYFNAKDWAPCQQRLERLYELNYRRPMSAMYIAEVCFNQGDVTGSIVWHRKALELDVKNELPQALEHMMFVTDAQPETTTEHATALRREWWTRYGQREYAKRQPHDLALDLDRTIRVGYLSADFRFHSAACAFATAITGHADDIEPFYYSTMEPKKYDGLAKMWAENYRDSWRDISDAKAWPTKRVVDRIRQDKIDILVDLAGVTAGNRLLAFAARPAPIQVQAWGYVLGANCPMFDVVFADRVIASPEVRAQLSERVVDLPTMLSYFPRPDLPPPNALPCLTKPPVFSVFNRAIKVNTDTLEVWRQILDRVPDAKIRFEGFDYSDRIQQTITAALGADRVFFTVGATDRAYKLDYLEVDLALDPWPQTGGVSSLDALFMGVPMVTLIGPRMIQRTSASFLTALGLPDFIATTREQYIDKAVALVTTQRTMLHQIRQSLRPAMIESRIIKGYRSAVEAAYRSLWREYCEHGQIRLH